MKRIILALVLLSWVPPGASAQDRIGYANLELIFSLMPEAQDVYQKLEAHQKELAKGLETKQAYAQQKLTEAQEADAAGVVSQAKLEEYRTELRRLEDEIRQGAADADRKMLMKRGELMGPVMEKLQSTIEAVAESDGYTHILNTMDGGGTSILLYAVEERDLTKRILDELGIAVPADEESAP